MFALESRNCNLAFIYGEVVAWSYRMRISVTFQSQVQTMLVHQLAKYSFPASVVGNAGFSKHISHTLGSGLSRITMFQSACNGRTLMHTCRVNIPLARDTGGT